MLQYSGEVGTVRTSTSLVVDDLHYPELPDFFEIHTIDGRNPVPLDIHKTLHMTGDSPYHYQLVQDFFHQQYHYISFVF